MHLTEVTLQPTDQSAPVDDVSSIHPGVPVRFRCDEGPQFSSRDFRMFLNRWGVKLSQSSPHYPQSNGHAESAVKSMKRLIQTSTENGHIDSEQFQKALLEWRNTARESGYSPSEILFGHPLRSTVPAHHRSSHRRWQEMGTEYDKKLKTLKKSLRTQ